MIKIGTDGAVCVKDDRGYGVVHGGETGLLCATCQFNKRACPHVLKVVSAINEYQPDVPTFLVPLSLCMEATKSRVHKSIPGLQSSKPIPFHFPSTLADVIKLPFSERFQIVDGICHLSESSTPSCPTCGHHEWETEDAQSTVVITQNQTFTACGKLKYMYLYMYLYLYFAITV